MKDVSTAILHLFSTDNKLYVYPIDSDKNTKSAMFGNWPIFPKHYLSASRYVAVVDQWHGHRNLVIQAVKIALLLS